jgi:hypothetical protein
MWQDWVEWASGIFGANQSNAPVMLVGDSPQALMVNLTLSSVSNQRFYRLKYP